MNRLARHHTGYALLACFLTLAASGDDFNLARVMLRNPLPADPADTLPLDDANTDFVRSTDATTLLDHALAADLTHATGAIADLVGRTSHDPRTGRETAPAPAEGIPLAHFLAPSVPIRC